MATLKQQEKPIVKKPQQRERHIPWMFCVALVITVFIAYRAWGLLEKRATAKKLNTAYEAELQQLAEKEDAMRTELQELQTPEGVEREIREKFRVTKQGEELVVVVPALNSVPIDDDARKGLFYFLRNLFKKEQ